MMLETVVVSEGETESGDDLEKAESLLTLGILPWRHLVSFPSPRAFQKKAQSGRSV
jgi:hypothetical protein